MEELLDVLDGIKDVTSGMQEDSTEARNVSRGRFGDIIETEARFGTHGTVCGHSDFGGGTGGCNNEIVTNKMKLVLLAGFVNVNEDVVPIVHLLPDVFIHLIGDNVGFV